MCCLRRFLPWNSSRICPVFRLPFASVRRSLLSAVHFCPRFTHTHLNLPGSDRRIEHLCCGKTTGSFNTQDTVGSEHHVQNENRRPAAAVVHVPDRRRQNRNARQTVSQSGGHDGQGNRFLAFVPSIVFDDAFSY